jgi:flagellar biosynthesis protein FliP
MRAANPRLLGRLIPVVLLASLTGLAFGQGLPIPNVNIGVGTAKDSSDVSASLQILALLTVLSVAPAILMLTTAFTRIVIIFSFLRNALGTPTIPPNQVLVGLSLFLTFYVMGPTYSQINDNALKPYVNKEIKFEQAIERAEKPLRAFMLKNTYEKDLLLFVNMRQEQPTGPDDVSMLSLIPAFIISELKTAFIIGFYIFVPFLIIDLIVASALMSMGMMMLPPVVVSLPAKVLVFVLADGWHTIVSAIMQGYG